MSQAGFFLVPRARAGRRSNQRCTRHSELGLCFCLSAASIWYSLRSRLVLRDLQARRGHGESPQHVVSPVGLVLSQIFLYSSNVLSAVLILLEINAAAGADGNYSPCLPGICCSVPHGLRAQSERLKER